MIIPYLTFPSSGAALTVFLYILIHSKTFFLRIWMVCIKHFSFIFIFLQELLSGSPSRSSSSLSFQSTPPPQQSPASFGQSLLNGLSRSFSDGVVAVSQSNSSSLQTVSGLMAPAAGIPQLNMNGVLSSLNGVIHSPLGNASQATLPTLRPQPPPLNPQALAQGFPFPKSVSPYVLKWLVARTRCHHLKGWWITRLRVVVCVSDLLSCLSSRSNFFLSSSSSNSSRFSHPRTSLL